MEKYSVALSPAGHDQPQCLLGVAVVGQLPDQVLPLVGDEAVRPVGGVLVELV